MRLVVNGEPFEADGAITVTELLARLDLGAGPVAVERNGDVVPRAEHPTTVLAEGDRVEVVHFVGGG
jgi:sulfur carrier protein